MVGTGVADDSGEVIIITSPLSQGIHKMKAATVDKAGNRSAAVTVPHIIINNGKKTRD